MTPTGISPILKLADFTSIVLLLSVQKGDDGDKERKSNLLQLLEQGRYWSVVQMDFEDGYVVKEDVTFWKVVLLYLRQLENHCQTHD